MEAAQTTQSKIRQGAVGRRLPFVGNLVHLLRQTPRLAMVKSFFKQVLLPSQTRPHTILSGPFRGITLYLNPQTQSQIWTGLFERQAARYLGSLCKEAAVCVDLGCKEGLYTIYFLLNTSARVIAIDAEQDPWFYRNLELNKCDLSRLTFVNEFIGDKTTLDDVVPSQGNSVIKIDVDGGEGVVLRGASRLLAARGTRWLVEYDYEETRTECRRLLPNSIDVPRPWWRGIIAETRRPDYGWLVSM